MSGARAPRAAADRPPDTVRVFGAPGGPGAGDPATREVAQEALSRLGYRGPLEPAGEEGFFRIVLPHYGLPPTEVKLGGGGRWIVEEADQNPEGAA